MMTKNLGESEVLNRNSSYLLIQARNPISALQYVPEQIQELLGGLNDTLKRSERGIDDINQLLPEVEKHANETTDKLQELESFLTETQYISEDAVKAANAYKDILENVKNAREAANSADNEAIVVVNTLSGIDDVMFDAEQNSSSALGRAFDLKSSTNEDLLPLLKAAEKKFEPVRLLHEENKKKLDDLERKLQMAPKNEYDEVYMNSTKNAELASARLKEGHLDTDKYFEKVSGDDSSL